MPVEAYDLSSAVLLLMGAHLVREVLHHYSFQTYLPLHLDVKQIIGLQSWATLQYFIALYIAWTNFFDVPYSNM